ncbi:hypothetical protein, partial [Streptomyces sp. NPDC046860]|uniref:hypothetical protein n=1 Tax=Streptomyces sp. NPDC046860 TaxID=3154495 RepID=UPI0033D3DA5F
LSTPPAFVLSQDQTLRECFPVIGTTHHESGTIGGIVRWFTASSLCFFKGTSSQLMLETGYQLNLALIFGTLLSSQGTVASFVLTLSGFPPGFPSVFPTLSDLFRSDFLGAFQVLAFAFPFPAVPTLSDPFGV